VKKSVLALLTLLLSPSAVRAKPLEYALSPEEFPANKAPMSIFAGEYRPDSFGQYSSGMSIQLPPARNGHVPVVQLSYSSSGGTGPLGVGWSMPIPHIQRSLRFGTPRYKGPDGTPYRPPVADRASFEDVFEFTLDDSSGELSYIGPHGGGDYLVYKPSDARSFAVFYYRVADDTWIVQDTDGTTYYMGETGARDTPSCGSPPCAPTFGWYARRVVDSFGNLIQYTYSTHAGVLYLGEIAYDLQLDATVTNHPRVVFTWTPNPSPRSISYRKGYRSELDAKQLAHVDVYGVSETGAQQSRRYTLNHTPLSEGRHISIHSITPQGLPAATFQYTPEFTALDVTASLANPTSTGAWNVQLLEERSLEMVRTPRNFSSFDRFSDCLAAINDPNHPEIDANEQVTTSMLVDVDGDGDLDQLVQIDPVYYGATGSAFRFWRRNDGAGFEQTSIVLDRPAGMGGCSSSPTSPASEVCVWNALDYSYNVAGSLLTWQRYIDINGDGKADFLHYDPTGQIWACLGDGNGNFGSPDCILWTPSPIARCGTGPICGSIPPGCPTFPHYGLGRTDPNGDLRRDIAGLFDVNGDGLPDYVRPYRVGTFDYLFAHLNTGTGFEATKYQLLATDTLETGGALREYRTVDVSEMRYELRDVNGDGLPDSLTLANIGAGFQIQFGNGPTTGTTGAVDTSHTVVFDEPVTLQASTPIGEYEFVSYLGWDTPTSPRYLVEGLADVTGDGIQDFVSYSESAQEYTYYPGTGNGFTSPQVLPIGQGFQPGLLRRLGAELMVGQYGDVLSSVVMTTQAFLDVDGDGIPELVRGADNPFGSTSGGREWLVSRSAASPRPPLKVDQVTSGVARDTITYGRPDAVQTPYAPWVVKHIEQADTAAPTLTPTRTQDLVYSAPSYDVFWRQFLGFQAVQQRENAGERLSTRSYFTGRSSQGLLQNATLWKDTEHMLQSVENDWETYAFDPGTPQARTWTRLKRVTTSVLDDEGQSSAAMTQIEYGYFNSESSENDFGLTHSVTRKGYLDPTTGANENTADDRINKRTYYLTTPLTGAPSHTRPRMARLHTDQDFSATLQLESSVALLYDAMCSNGPMTHGAPCKKSVARGFGLPDAETRTEFDDYGRLTYEIDPDGLRTDYAYHGGTSPHVHSTLNSFGHQVYFRDYHALSGAAGTVCGPQHRGSPEADVCREYTFDSHGRLVDEKLPFFNGSAYERHSVHRYQYNDSATPPTVIAETEQENPTHHLAIPLPVVQQRTYFNRWGQVIAANTTWPGQEGCAGTHFAYDELGRPRTAWLPKLQSCTFSAATTEPNSYSYTHDKLDRLTRAQHSDGSYKKAEYTSRKVTVLEGHYTVLSNVELTHNGFGEVSQTRKTIYNDQLVTTYQRDALGRVTGALDGENGTYTYSYYVDGPVRTAQTPSLQAVEYSYTPGGQLASQIWPNGSSVTFERQMGRPVIRTVTSDGLCAEHGTRTQRYAYDEQTWNTGHLTSVEGDDFFKVLDYDARGNLASQALHAETDLAMHTVYTASGSPLKTFYPSGRVATQRYDVAGKLERVSDDLGTFDISVSHHVSGKPGAVGGWVQGAGRLEFLRSLGYDSKQRLDVLNTHFGSTGTPGTIWNMTYVHSDNDLVATVTDDYRDFARDYAHDQAKRLQFVRPAGQYFNNLYEYTYNKNGALHHAEGGGLSDNYYYTSANKQLVASVQGSGYSIAVNYDAAGQQCAAVRTGADPYQRQYTWYGDGNIATITQGPSFVRYDYDEAGARWKVEREGEVFPGTTLHLGDLLESQNGDVTEYVHVPTARIALTMKGNQRVYFSDAMNTAVVVQDNGQVIQATDYTPYGRELPVTQLAASTFSFNGKRREPGTGVLYYGARYYDPEIRQFASVDPLRQPSDLHPFSYAGLDPTTLMDFLGLDPVVNYLFHAETGGKYDTFTSANWGAESNAAVQSVAFWVNSAVNLTAFATNLVINAGEYAGDGVSHVTGTTKAERDAIPTFAVFGGLSKISTLIRGAREASLAKGAVGLRSWKDAGISARAATRIQNAVNKTRQRITVVGSRAAGEANSLSDWDYILSGASRQRSRAKNSVPHGIAGGERIGTTETGADFWQDYNAAARSYNPVDKTQPHVVFEPTTIRR